MNAIQIEFPEHFEDDAPLIESKGYLDGVAAVIRGRRYKFIFYDRVRLMQEIEAELTKVAAYWEGNLVVLIAVTRRNIEAAIVQISNSKRIEEFRPEDS
ncbi:MAG: hypothetical protein NXI24_15890 [bacterium]|nr:hypothetical protein [bacterium]